ncbi:MFS transporter [Lentzea roselyniae]|uniref:MFS transporter n=1 Tax=Lentzea roselyniae TaxID=531940 RepID=A0ABP7CCE9_9PSEU
MAADVTSKTSPRWLGPARWAVAAVFGFNGFQFSTWTSRVPAIATQVEAGAGGLGVALTVSAVGMLVATPFAGRVRAWLGPRWSVLVPASGAALLLPAVGLVRTVTQLASVLFVLSGFVGIMNVASNLSGLAIARDLNRPVMPFFYGVAGLAGFGGAGASSFLAHAGWSPLEHFTAASAFSLLLLACSARFLPVFDEPDRAEHVRGGRARVQRRVLGFAVAAFVITLAESTAYDWFGLLLTRERGVTEAATASGLAVLSLVVAGLRLVGERVEAVVPTRVLLIGGAALAASGMVLIATNALPGFVVAAYAVVGAGVAYLYPAVVGQINSGTATQTNMSVVAWANSLGYAVGPILVGTLAERLSITTGVLVVACVLVAGISITLPMTARRR